MQMEQSLTALPARCSVPVPGFSECRMTHVKAAVTFKESNVPDELPVSCIYKKVSGAFPQCGLFLALTNVHG